MIKTNTINVVYKNRPIRNHSGNELIADETIWSGEIDRRLLRSDAASCVNVDKSGGSGGKPRGGRVAVLNVALETLVTSRKLDN